MCQKKKITHISKARIKQMWLKIIYRESGWRGYRILKFILATSLSLNLYQHINKKLKKEWKFHLRASLVAQWQRIHLPMQETWVRSLVWEDPTCSGATKPVYHNYWARALEPRSRNYWAYKPQLLEPVLCNKRSHRNEESMQHHWRVAPACCN